MLLDSLNLTCLKPCRNLLHSMCKYEEIASGKVSPDEMIGLRLEQQALKQNNLSSFRALCTG